MRRAEYILSFYWVDAFYSGWEMYLIGLLRRYHRPLGKDGRAFFFLLWCFGRVFYETHYGHAFSDVECVAFHKVNGIPTLLSHSPLPHSPLSLSPSPFIHGVNGIPTLLSPGFDQIVTSASLETIAQIVSLLFLN